MKASVYDEYGPPDVLRIEDVERPVPGPEDILVRIHATTVNRTDTQTRKAEPFVSRFLTGLRRPRYRILGSEFAGEVAARGAAAGDFQVGQQVFGISPWRFGAHAELIAVRASGPVAPKPENLTVEQSAAVCDGGLLALSALRPVEDALTWLKPGDLHPGQAVLIYGASGSIGTAGVQLAKHFGTRVTAVCNTKNVEVVRSLGADEVIDYTQQDFTKNGQTYDVIFDAVGKHSFKRSKGSLKPGGAFIATDDLENLFRALSPVHPDGKRVCFPIPPRFTKKDVLFIKGLIEAGKYRPVIDRTYTLDQMIEAASYVETEQKTGNVVIRVA